VQGLLAFSITLAARNQGMLGGLYVALACTAVGILQEARLSAMA